MPSRKPETIEVIKSREEKQCGKCQLSKPLDNFHRDKNSLDGRYWVCIPCRKINSHASNIRRRKKITEYTRARRKTEEGKAMRRKEFEKRRLLSPEKYKANYTLTNAIRDGRIVRQPCEVCGGKAQGHHPDYSKPLEVIWLCAKHHQEHHNNLRIL